MALSAVPDWVHYVKAFGQAVTWVIVIIGWFIVNDHNNKRETRKEIRSQVDDFKELLKNLEELAISYHTEKCHDEAKANRIKTTISRVVKYVGRLPFVEDGECSDFLVTIRKSITLKNFETSEHIGMSPSSDLVRDIIYSVDELTDFIETQYSKNFMGKV